MLTLVSNSTSHPSGSEDSDFSDWSVDETEFLDSVPLGNDFSIGDVLSEGDQPSFRMVNQSDGTITFISPGVKDVLGFDAEDVVGRNWQEFVPLACKSNRQILELDRRRFRGDGPHRYECELPNSAGEMRTIRIHSFGIQSSADGAIENFTVATDCTTSRHDESGDVSSHVEHGDNDVFDVDGSSTELARLLAHELSQPLAVVFSYLDETLNEYRAHRRINEGWLRTARDATTLAVDILGRLKESAVSKPKHATTVDLVGVVRRITSLLGLRLRKNQIDLLLDLPDSACLIDADQVQIKEVLMNVVANAIDALQDYESSVLEKQILVSVCSDGDSFLLRVRDNGVGVRPEYAETLFTPFKSTKPSGMGIGLSIAQRIVTRHKGRIWYEPNLPQGTIFSVQLPKSTRPNA